MVRILTDPRIGYEPRSRSGFEAPSAVTASYDPNNGDDAWLCTELAAASMEMFTGYD